MGRAPCCDKSKVKRGPWSPEEDAKLKSYIQQNGTGGNWIALPQKIGLKRCGKSCRLRWLNYLRPNIKHGGFSDEEDEIICALYISIGSRWSIIAGQLPGRTDNDIKNYWNTKLKKKLLLGRQRKAALLQHHAAAHRGRPSTNNTTHVHQQQQEEMNYNMIKTEETNFTQRKAGSTNLQPYYWPQPPQNPPPHPDHHHPHNPNPNPNIAAGSYHDDVLQLNTIIDYNSTSSTFHNYPALALSADNNYQLQAHLHDINNVNITNSINNINLVHPPASTTTSPLSTSTCYQLPYPINSSPYDHSGTDQSLNNFPNIIHVMDDTTTFLYRMIECTLMSSEVVDVAATGNGTGSSNSTNNYNNSSSTNCSGEISTSTGWGPGGSGGGDTSSFVYSPMVSSAVVDYSNINNYENDEHHRQSMWAFEEPRYHGVSIIN